MRTASVAVTTEDGRTMLLERVTPAQLESEHFRAQLAERLQWAVQDAAEETEPEALAIAP